MRGKSIDSEFVSSFIQECASKGKVTPEDVCEEVLSRIAEIDRQLKYRIKLSDVLSFFNYKKKSVPAKLAANIIEENVDKDIAKQIVDYLTNHSEISEVESTPINLVVLLSRNDECKKNQIAFTIKQLLRTRVLGMRADETLYVTASNL